MPLPAMAMLLVFWFAGSMLLGLDLGRISDDCSLNLRDAATGQIPAGVNPLMPYPYFFRPLHLALTFGVGTYLPNADRLMHALSALSHLGACMALVVFARRACRGGVHSPWLAPALCTLVFMTWPTQSEVILWYSTISTSLSVWVYIGLGWLICEYVSGGARRSRLGSPVGILMAGFVIACLYEQPLAGSVALPILAIGARRGEDVSGLVPASRSLAGRLRRVLVAMAMCLLAGGIYAALLLMTSPVGTRGGQGSFVPAHALFGRAQELWGSIGYVLWGKYAHDTLLGAMTTGLHTLAGSRGTMLAALVLAASVTALFWAMKRESVHDQREAALDTRSQLTLDPRWTMLAAIVAMIAGWVPVYVVNGQLVQDRNVYFPLAMLVLAFSPLLDAVLRRVPRVSARPAVVILTVACFGIATFGVISQVGWQRVFRDRSRRDQHILAAIVELMPSPPPGAVFVPMRGDNPIARTGYRRFDAQPMSVVDTHWSFTDELRRAYERSDIACAGWARWTPPTLCTLSLRGASISESAARSWTRADASRQRDWSTIVPLTITPEGEVHLVRLIEVEKANGSILRIPVESVRTAAKQNRKARGRLASHRTWDESWTSEQNAPAPTALFWRWGASNEPAAFPRSYVWFGQRESEALHPHIEGGTRAELRTTIEPSPAQRRVCVYVTIADADLAKCDDSDRALVTLSTTATGGEVRQSRLSATIELHAKDTRDLRGWLPLVLDLPASATSVDLSLRVSHQSQGESKPAGAMPIVHVTPGMIVDALVESEPAGASTTPSTTP